MSLWPRSAILLFFQNRDHCYWIGQLSASISENQASLYSHDLINSSSFVWNYQHPKPGHHAPSLGGRHRSAGRTEQGARSRLWTSHYSSSDCSEHVSVSRLGGLLVLDHLVFDSNQNLLESVRWVPVGEHVESRLLDLSVLLVNAWQVDLWLEVEGWRTSWVIFTTFDG